MTKSKLNISVEVQQVIIVTTATGDGKNEPIRGVTQIWSMDGVLIAELDPYYDK